MYAVWTLSRTRGSVTEMAVRNRPGRPCARARAVHARGLVDLRRDPLDGRDEQHRVEADEAPDDYEHGRRHRRTGVAEPGEVLEPAEAELGEGGVEEARRRVVDLRPDEADDDGRDGVREERHHPVEPGRPDPAD